MTTTWLNKFSIRQGLEQVGRGLSWLAIVPIMATLIWLGLRGRETQDEIRNASQRAVHVAELRGTIASLDQWLSLAAQVAVSTGEERWSEEYADAAQTLEAAMTEAAKLASPEARAALASTVGEAHRDITVMERRALELASSGDRDAARVLLNGPEYRYLQDVYANGANVFSQELTAMERKRSADLDERAWLETAGLGLSAIVLGAMALSLRGRSRLQGALAQTAAVARTDSLTGLPNRRHFFEELERALAAAHRTGPHHALLLIDLDRFKAANDGHGHLAGDELLRMVAARLRDVLGPDTRIARLGGDEFAALLCCENKDGERSGTSPGAAAGRIVDSLGQPFSLTGGGVLQIGASVGIGLTHVEDNEPETLMRRADVALYRAKADGRGCFRFFEQGMDAHVRARALLEGELRLAVANQAFLPYFQPQVEIATGRLVGVEMLARWPNPNRGMIPPAEFIPIAESLGLIGPMTERLLRSACRAAAGWPSHVSLACNISPIQLRDPNLAAMVRAILTDTKFPPERLEVEITESAFVGDMELARALLEQLKNLGVRLALDDFGTGYSGLRHLQALPFDKVKIDRSFVAAVTGDPESRKIVSAVLGLTRSLGLTAVAEGVETAETAAALRDLGCEVGQGWYFGYPASAERIDAMLDEQQMTEASILRVA